MKKIIEQTGFWIAGCDSRNDPAYVGQNNYIWGINGLHRGGIFRTRPGFCELLLPPLPGVLDDVYHPQGLTVFKPQDGTVYLVMAHAGKIYKSPYPFESWTQIMALQFYPFAKVVFARATKSTVTNSDGSLTFVKQPYDVLIVQDGFSRAGYWDGTAAGHLNPSPSTNQTPIGHTMLWNSQRLWVANGHRLHASNFGDPLTFTEADVVASGGFFVLPDEITAIGETPDLQSLLVWTAETTTSFQSSIEDRDQWRQTAGFQHELFKKIGCVGPRAWINQYGITYWMSHNGIVELDQALQTYRTKRLNYSDYAMNFSKKRLAKDLRDVCAGSFENFCFFSVPSGDRYNAHTWVMDETSYESANQESRSSSSWAGVWKGIRPVEWVTAVVDGVNRCFALSRDYANGVLNGSYQIGIWEAFCPQRADVLLEGTVRPITCGLELRQLAFTAEPKKINFLEWDVSELKNAVSVRMFWSGRRSGFRPCGQKIIVANEFSPDLTDIQEYSPQSRILRSETILIGSAQAQSAQSRNIQSIDRAFGSYLEWDGDMAVHSARLFAEIFPEDQVGRAETNEVGSRLLGWDGQERVLAAAAPAPLPRRKTSSFVDSLTQRFIEPFYSSR